MAARATKGALRSTTRFVALLRGINVGGNNLVRMADLVAAFERMGFADVATFIASGNVLFSSRAATKARLTATIERALSDAFGYAASVVVLSADDLRAVVAQAPEGFGGDLERYRYDVAFVKPPLVARDAVGEVPAKPGIDTVLAGDHALYYRRLVAKASQSQLVRLTQRPIYKRLTIRNWNTTTKLAKLVEG